MRQYKKKIVITSGITLLPMLIGILLWDRLPDSIATHFGSDGTPNDWSSKVLAVFGLPIFMCAMHLLCIAATLNDPKKKNIGKMMLSVIFWLVPVCSLVANGVTLAYAMGVQVDINMIVGGMIGIMFLVLGNYMSKNHQNYTVGIKLPWTLSSEENWDKTHRLAGRLWILGGILLLVNIFLRIDAILIGVILLAALIPMIYSFILYKKEQ